MTTTINSHESVRYDFDAGTWTCECGFSGPIPVGWNRASAYLAHAETPADPFVGIVDVPTNDGWDA